MKLTKREKTLLYIMTLFLLAAGVSIFLITPMMKALNNAELVVEEKQQRVDNLHVIIDDMDHVKNVENDLIDTIEDLSRPFYQLTTNNLLDYTFIEIFNKYSIKPMSSMIQGATYKKIPAFMEALKETDTENQALYVATTTFDILVKARKDDFVAFYDKISAIDGIRVKSFSITSEAKKEGDVLSEPIEGAVEAINTQPSDEKSISMCIEAYQIKR